MIRPTYVNPGRRDLLKKLAALGIVATISPMALPGCKPKKTTIAGTWKRDGTYESLRKSMVAIANVSDRLPDVIVQPLNWKGSQEALAFARENDLQVVCRTSGHNTAGAVLRNGGMLLDISNMNQIEVDPVNKTAKVEPAVRFEQLYEAVNKHGLGYPYGDCSHVTLGGYLLGGGLGNNGNYYTKGPACYSLKSADVLMADGRTITATRENYPDIFWALSGCGPGFFGMVTSYTIDLYEPLGAIVKSNYTFAVEALEEILSFFDDRMEAKDERINTSIQLVKGKEASDSTQVRVSLTATTVAGENALADARKLLNYYTDEGIGDKAIDKDEFQIGSVEGVFFNYPPGFRTNTDNIYTDDPKAIVAVVDQFKKASDIRVSMSLNHFMNMHPFRSDACFAPGGKHFVNYHINWMDAQYDEKASAWMKETEAILRPYKKAHYINQTDNATFPGHIKDSFSEESWERLSILRKKYDPDALFFSYLGT